MSRIFTKATESKIDGIDKKSREVAAYFSIYENRDHVGDVSHLGMFSKTIGPGSRLARGLVPCKHNHETIVGKGISAREESKGCLGVTKYATDPVSDRIFEMVCDGTIPTLSFKYSVPEGGSKIERKDGVSTRHLYEVELYEFGPVDPDLAANDATHVYGAKGLMELAGALSSINAVDCDERWARQALENLTDEERAFLSNLSEILDKLGGAARSLMVGDLGDTGDASSTYSDEEEQAKAVLSFVTSVNKSCESTLLDLSLKSFTETLSNFPALLKATG